MLPEIRHDENGLHELWVNGRKYIEKESFTICANVEAYILRGTFDTTECGEIAESIFNKEV